MSLLASFPRQPRAVLVSFSKSACVDDSTLHERQRPPRVSTTAFLYPCRIGPIIDHEAVVPPHPPPPLPPRPTMTTTTPLTSHSSAHPSTPPNDTTAHSANSAHNNNNNTTHSSRPPSHPPHSSRPGRGDGRVRWRQWRSTWMTRMCTSRHVTGCK